jgi:esterase FrsA
MHEIIIENHKLHFVGPSKEEGPKPAFFYFSLSAKDSLLTHPYNQPATYLSQFPIRIFSATLPEHEEGKLPQDAIQKWADCFEKGIDLISPFIDDMANCISKLVEMQLVLPKKIAIGGLSRGGFIACHIASKVKEISHILGFAPLTFLSHTAEFIKTGISSAVEHLDILHLKDMLFHRSIRFYIGNRDLRVSTADCFECIRTFADTAFDHRIRSSSIEMIIGPSIGHLGHGTSPEVFQSGAEWIRNAFAK